MGDHPIPTDRWQWGVTLYVAADMSLKIMWFAGHGL